MTKQLRYGITTPALAREVYFGDTEGLADDQIEFIQKNGEIIKGPIEIKNLSISRISQKGSTPPSSPSLICLTKN